MTAADHDEQQAPAAVRRATIREVAEAAGVSRSTASRAMTGRGYVATDVRARVIEAAETLGYVPDTTARYLKQQVSRSIGVMVSDLKDSFYARLAAGAGQAMRSRGYNMMLAEDDGSVAEQLAAAETFVAMRVAGVLVTPVSADVTTYLARYHVPVVEVDRQFAPGVCDAVVIDNHDTAAAVTRHLTELGHRRIALLIDEMTWTTGKERHAGYLDALAEAGIDADPRLVVSCPSDPGAAHAAATTLLAGHSHPTAVFAVNNLVAEGVWRAAAELGLRIPDDLSLVAFDEARWMSLVTPGVTTVAQDEAALGEVAVRRLVERISTPALAPVTIVTSTEVIHRRSTAAPR